MNEFNDKSILAKCYAYHIEKIEFFLTGQVLSGIAVDYSLDGVKLWKNHKGKGKSEFSYTLELAKEEFINYLQITKVEEGIIDVKIKTSQGNMLIFEDEDNEGAQHKNLHTKRGKKT